MVTIVVRKTKKVKFTVFENLKNFHRKINKHLTGKVTAITDDYTIYNRLKELEKVEEYLTVKHSEGEYAKGEVHVNGCENRHSFVRSFLVKYRGVSKHRLQGYLNFLSLKLNERHTWFKLLLSDRLKK